MHGAPIGGIHPTGALRAAGTASLCRERQPWAVWLGSAGPAVLAVTSPRHQYGDRNSGLTDIYLRLDARITDDRQTHPHLCYIISGRAVYRD